MFSLLTMMMSKIWCHILNCVVVVVVEENWIMAHLLFLWLSLLVQVFVVVYDENCGTC